MIGDRFTVCYQLNGDPCATLHTAKPHDAWQDAKAERNTVFYDWAGVSRAWIMRDNPSMNLRADKYGAVMEKERVS